MEKTIKAIRLTILYSLIFLLPITVLPISANPFVVSKIALLVFGIAALLILRAIEVIHSGKLKFSLSSYDLPVAIIILAYILSSVFQTQNIMDAVLLPGTATAVVAGGILFFLINQESKTDKYRIKMALVISSALYALLTFFGFAKVFALIPQLPTFLQNPNFTPEGGYLPSLVFLVALLPIAVTTFIKEKDLVNKSFLGVSIAIMVLGVGLSIYQILPGRPTTPQLSPYQTSWSVAVEVLKREPILGIGPGDYLTAFSRFRPIEYNATDFWAIRFSSARSFFLTLLTETGLLGLAGLAILLVVVYRNVKQLIKSEKIYTENYGSWISLIILIVLLALFPATVLITTLFFVLLSFSAKTTRTELTLTAKSAHSSAASRFPAVMITLPIFLLVLAGLYYSIVILTAEYRFARALSYLSQNKVQPTVNTLVSAINLNPSVDRYRATYARVNLALADSLARKEEITDQDRETLAQLVQLSISEAKSAVAANPLRAGNWEVLGRTYQAIIPVAQGADVFAAQSIQQAVALDPLNPNLRIALGGLFYQAENYKEAIKIFELAVQVKPDLANAHYNLAHAYKQDGQLENAVREMTVVLSLIDSSSQDYQIAKQALEEMEKTLESQSESTETPSTEGGEELSAPPEGEDPLLDPQLELPEDAAPPEAPETDIQSDGDNGASPSPSPSPTPSPSASPR